MHIYSFFVTLYKQALLIAMNKYLLLTFITFASILLNNGRISANATISGRVYVSSSVGIPDVLVTDGFNITLTDENGNYS